MVVASDLPPAPPAQVLVHVRRGHVVPLRLGPRGRVVLRAGSRTEFGSPRVYWAQRVRSGWAAVRDARGGNKRLLWLKLGPSVTVSRTRWNILIDRSSRRLQLRYDDRVVRTVPVATGRSTSPTPVGRYHVTDKLRGGGYYGCCIIALSAVQRRPPPGWVGPNRVAIHGTTAAGSIGSAASAGCLRAHDRDRRAIWSRIPRGTPVRIAA